ncbi:MAG: rod shape-determining protein [Patescibacteria group bacterium]
MSRKIGIDLGTTNTLVFVPGNGIKINEPSVVAISLFDNRILAVGSLAKEMVGRAPDTISVVKPLKEGVIADYKVTQAMIKYFINKSFNKFNFSKKEILISVPVAINSTERRAVIEAGMNAGVKAVYLVKEPVLAAIGAGIPINSSYGHMVVNIGGGTTEVAIISLGGVVVSAGIRCGGNKIDQGIIDYVKKKHNLAIGERTAELIKINIGTAVRISSEETLSIRGRDLVTGLPKTIDITSNEVNEAIQEQLKEISQVVKKVLQETPPELCADIIERGIMLTGGSALLKNMDVFVTRVTGVTSHIADEPLLCVAKGTGMVLENLDIYKRNIITRR